MAAAQAAAVHGGDFADKALGAQAAFRQIMHAVAMPGTVVSLAPDGPGLPPLDRAAAAVALTLFDQATPVWLSPALCGPGLVERLRFLRQCPIVDDARQAAFAVFVGDEADVPFDWFDLGEPRRPHLGATLVVRCASLTDGVRRRLTGPGIRTSATLAVAGVSDRFLAWRRGLEPRFPLGVDILFTAADALCAVPRTTRIEEV